MSNHNTKPSLSAHNQLLLKALYDQTFLNDLPFVSLQNYQLQGVITVDPLERNTILALINDDHDLAAIQFVHADTQPLFIEANHFDLTDKDPSFDYTLGYAGSDSHGNLETLSLVLTLKHQHETIGFFKFTINHDIAMLDNHYLKISLEKRYVQPANQDQPHLLDLICGVRSFLCAMSECLINTMNANENITFCLTDDYEAEDGTKVGNILRHELSEILEELAISYPQKIDCFNQSVMHVDASVY